MLGLFEKLTPHVKLQSGKVRVENLAFRLHYRLTSMLLLLGCILVSATQFIGEPIQCINTFMPDDEQFGKACNTYCWIMSTFTLPHLYDKEVGVEVAHPGVGPHTEEVDKKYHAYYQWVPFVLLLQAMMFYATHYIWKNIEGGQLKNVLNGLDALMLDKEAREKKQEQVAKYLEKTKGRHTFWFAEYIFFEILNFFHVIGQIYFTDKFLGYEFTTYGADVIKFMEEDPENRTDPMTRVFPRVTKCTFHTFGQSGTIQKIDNLCVLALNIVNEKIYTVFWFWFVILAIISGLTLLYRVATILSNAVRLYLLRMRGGGQNGDLVEVITGKLGRADWFLLYHIGKHMDPLHYEGFLEKVGEVFHVFGDNSEEMKPLRKSVD